MPSANFYTNLISDGISNDIRKNPSTGWKQKWNLLVASLLF